MIKIDFNIEKLRYITFLKLFSNQNRNMFKFSDTWEIYFNTDFFQWRDKLKEQDVLKFWQVKFLFDFLKKKNSWLVNQIKTEIESTKQKKVFAPIYVFWKNFKYKIFPFLSSWERADILLHMKDQDLIYELIKFWVLNKEWKIFLEKYMIEIYSQLFQYEEYTWVDVNKDSLTNEVLILLNKYYNKLIEIFNTIYSNFSYWKDESTLNNLNNYSKQVWKILVNIEKRKLQSLCSFEYTEYTNFWVRFDEDYQQL